MLSAETIITFFTASILLGVAPGPDNIFVLTQSALHGRTAGIVVMFGLCTGLVFHSAAVAFGVAAIFRTSAIAFSALKSLGVAYLLVLAWQAFRKGGGKVSLGSCRQCDHRRLYLRGIVMNVTNPKVSIFFLAFLPQFAQPDRGAVTLQILLLGGLFILATILVFGAVAILAGAIGRWLARSERAQIALNRLAGAVFVGLALKLVVTER
jgi:threonine/homoserine/homoserine lactone efflux protein